MAEVKYMDSDLNRLLARWGRFSSVQRFLTKYGKVNTKRGYLFQLDRYYRWLQSERITQSPDELIIDNLKCVFETSATDVDTKRRHTDWLNTFVNVHLLGRGIPESSRVIAASAIKQFYKRNDSPLFGDFQVAAGEVRATMPIPEGEDVRRVLKAMPLPQRAPLLVIWQTSMEINRVLSLKWGDVAGIDQGEYPVRVKLFGRKRHKRSYHTYIGRDSIEHLKMWREQSKELLKREPRPEDYVFLGKYGTPMARTHLNKVLRETARRIHAQGLVKNGNAGSWHSHYLRHSFNTEAKHAGVSAEIRDFFEGHLDGIKWVYDHSDQLHEEDLIREYLKIEPYVSLNPEEVALTSKYEDREKSLLRRIIALEQRLEKYLPQSSS